MSHQFAFAKLNGNMWIPKYRHLNIELALCFLNKYSNKCITFASPYTSSLQQRVFLPHPCFCCPASHLTILIRKAWMSRNQSCYYYHFLLLILKTETSLIKPLRKSFIQNPPSGGNFKNVYQGWVFGAVVRTPTSLSAPGFTSQFWLLTAAPLKGKAEGQGMTQLRQSLPATWETQLCRHRRSEPTKLPPLTSSASLKNRQQLKKERAIWCWHGLGLWVVMLGLSL